MDAPWLSNLNPAQRAAATAPNGPLLIIAGAGTGKTNTLAHRVAHLIATGIAPDRILLLTFTRRAAAEMIKRVEALLACGTAPSLPAPRLRRLWGGTFHSISNRILRASARALGLPEHFTVIDRADAEDLLNTVRSELELDRAESRFPRKGTCLSIYSRCVNAQESVEDATQRCFPWCSAHAGPLKSLFRAYAERKQAQDILDYDDLLLYWHHLMEQEPLAAEVRSRFDAVLVDEYQDTNALQARILQRLCPDGRGLTVVGDDAQAIYSFRAATIHNILGFPRTYPAAIAVTLEQNYRSAQPILDAANAVIAQSPQRHEKNLVSTRASGQKPILATLADEDQQNDYLVRRILERHEAGIPLRRQAVLFRAAHHSDALEIELARRNIPFVKYGGLKFLEAAHVKDMLCILRLAENPRDGTSAFRVLQLMDGIGPSHARRAIAHLAGGQFDLRAWQEFPPPPAAESQWPQFVQLLLALSAEPPPPLDGQIAIARRFYAPILDRRYDQAHIRRRDLDQLEQISGNFASRESLLTELALDPPSSTQDLAGDPLLEEDYLILSTIHSAKGCEWDAVYIIHAADGNIPSDMASGSDEQIEEERRLLYVAMTRARDFLEICFPIRYYHKKWATGDRHTCAQLTRFLPELLLHHFERKTLQPSPQLQFLVAQADVSAEIRRKIAAMWS